MLNRLSDNSATESKPALVCYFGRWVDLRLLRTVFDLFLISNV